MIWYDTWDHKYIAKYKYESRDTSKHKRYCLGNTARQGGPHQITLTSMFYNLHLSLLKHALWVPWRFAERHVTKCHFAEDQFVECHFAECQFVEYQSVYSLSFRWMSTEMTFNEMTMSRRIDVWQTRKIGLQVAIAKVRHRKNPGIGWERKFDSGRRLRCGFGLASRLGVTSLIRLPLIRSRYFGLGKVGQVREGLSRQG